MYQIRRVDDLGRVVIPKEIRKLLHIREGDALEIYVDQQYGCVYMKKHDFEPDYKEMWENLKRNKPEVLEYMEELERIYNGE